MAFWVAYCTLAGAVAYLLGSIPTGYWLGKLKGIDIRDHGSKGTGATNVLRTLGKGPALVALLVDLLKGVAAVAYVISRHTANIRRLFAGTEPRIGQSQRT